MDLGTQIRRARVNRNITQSELAEQIFCTRQQISHYETGRRIPGEKERERLEEVLQIKLYTRRAAMQLKTLSEIGSTQELENTIEKLGEEIARGYGRYYEKVLALALFVSAAHELCFTEDGAEPGWSGAGSGLYHFFLMSPVQSVREFEVLLQQLQERFYEKMKSGDDFQKEICSAAVSKISDLLLVYPKDGGSFTDTFRVLVLEASEVLESL